MIQQDFLSISDFAKWIGVHPNTVRNMIRNKRLSAFKIGYGKTGAYRIAKSEVNRMAEVDLNDYVKKEIKKGIKKG